MRTRFFDTTILAYLASADASKANVAQSLLAGGGVISVHVLNELANVSRRKMGLSWPETQAFLSTIRAFMRVEPLAQQTEAPRVCRRLQLLSIRVGQARFGTQVRLSLIRALAMTMSLRMMATRATFFCFPAAVSRS